MAVDFLLKSHTYQKNTLPEVRMRRAVVSCYLQIDYTIHPSQIKPAVTHLRNVGVTYATKKTVLEDVVVYRRAYEYLTGMVPEREELLKSKEQWRKVIDYLRKDRIETWNDLGYSINPIPIITDVSKVRIWTKMPASAPKAPKPSPKPKRERLFGRDLKLSRICQTETRRLFKAVGEKRLPFDFVFEEIKPLAEFRAKKTEKEFLLSEEFLRRALTETGSGFRLKDGRVTMSKRRGKSTGLKKR